MNQQLETGLIQLINERLGISPSGFTKIAGLSSNEFRGGVVKEEDIYFIILHRNFQEHQENYISVRSNERNYYIGYAFQDQEIINIQFTELVNDRFILCNTAMKLSIGLFIEMISQLPERLEIVPAEDSKLFDYEKFYIGSYPDDI